MREHTESEKRLLADPDARNAYDNYEVLTKLGNALRELRLEARLSQQQLQALSGVNQADISRVEQGAMERGPSLAVVRKIASSLGFQVTLSLRKQDDETGSSRVTLEL